MNNSQLARNNAKYLVQINLQLIKNQGQNSGLHGYLSILFFEVKKVYTIFNLKSKSEI